MTISIKYIAYANSSGYGLSALGYIRARHNLGVPVWWKPSFLGGPADRIWRPDQGLAALPLARTAAGDPSLSDLPALAQGLCRPIEYDTMIMHTGPNTGRGSRSGEGRTSAIRPGKPMRCPITSRRCSRCRTSCVPSKSNGELFPRGAGGKPVHVVPHVLFNTRL